MTIIKRIKSVILTLLVSYLAVILAARYIAEPALKTHLAGSTAYIAGVIILLAFIQMTNMCTAWIFNMEKSMQAIIFFRRFEPKLGRIGIKTPLDFSFAMCNVATYRYLPEGFLFPIVVKRRRPIPGNCIDRSILEFEKRFGRKPEGYESGDWDTISKAETAICVKKDIDEVQPSDFICNISPAVLEYFHASLSDDHQDAA